MRIDVCREDFTPRQRDIMDKIASGAMLKVVAAGYGVSYTNILVDKRLAFARLNAKSRQDAFTKWGELQREVKP